MAEAALFTVTEEERRIARELSTQHYYDILADERAEGREEGRIEGEAIGFDRGLQQKSLETARLMRLENLDINLISKVTGLSEAEIEKL